MRSGNTFGHLLGNQPDREPDRQTDRERERERERRPEKQADGQDRPTDRHRQAGRQTDGQTGREPKSLSFEALCLMAMLDVPFHNILSRLLLLSCNTRSKPDRKTGRQITHAHDTRSEEPAPALQVSRHQLGMAP